MTSLKKTLKRVLALSIVACLAILPVVVSAAVPTPNASIDYSNERLTGLTQHAYHKITFDPYDGYTEIDHASDGTIAIREEWFGRTISIKVESGEEYSEAQIIDIPWRPFSPSVSAVNATSIGGTGGISGTTMQMEYKLANDAVWTTCPGGNTMGLTAGTYDVRYKATSSDFASHATQVTITEFTPTQEPTPNASIDFVNEKLTGLINGTYSFGGANTSVADNTYSIDESWMTGNPLSIIKKGDGTTTTDSAAQNLPIPARLSAPGVLGENETVDGRNDGKITGVDATMEWSGDNGASWTACTGSAVTGLAPGAYLVRVKAVANTSFKSNPASVTIVTGVAQTRDLTVTAPAFSDVWAGYSRPAAQSITIANSGNSNAAISNVSVSGTAFEIGGSGNTVASGGSITTWTVQPKAGLYAGTYSETITVTSDNGATATASVSFTVKSNPSTTITTPGAPRNLWATSGNKQVTLTWSAPLSDGGSVITRYEVSVNGGAWVTVTSGNAYTFTGLVNGQSYEFRVRAVNSMGYGAEATIKATPQATGIVVPQTGDNNNLWLGAALSLLSALNIVYVLARRKRRAL